MGEFQFHDGMTNTGFFFSYYVSRIFSKLQSVMPRGAGASTRTSTRMGEVCIARGGLCLLSTYFLLSSTISIIPFLWQNNARCT